MARPRLRGAVAARKPFRGSGAPFRRWPLTAPERSAGAEALDDRHAQGLHAVDLLRILGPVVVGDGLRFSLAEDARELVDGRLVRLVELHGDAVFPVGVLSIPLPRLVELAG